MASLEEDESAVVGPGLGRAEDTLRQLKAGTRRRLIHVGPATFFQPFSCGISGFCGKNTRTGGLDVRATVQANGKTDVSEGTVA